MGRPANDLAQTDKEKPRLQAGALALCAILKAMRADDRETGPRTDQQVDAVAGVMAQVDGDLPSAGTHSASYWRRGSEPARSGVGAIRGGSRDCLTPASHTAPHRLSTWRKRGAGWQRRVECSLTDPCQRKEPAPGIRAGGWFAFGMTTSSAPVCRACGQRRRRVSLPVSASPSRASQQVNGPPQSASGHAGH